jgi:hypothetical protein
MKSIEYIEIFSSVVSPSKLEWNRHYDNTSNDFTSNENS